MWAFEVICFNCNGSGEKKIAVPCTLMGVHDVFQFVQFHTAVRISPRKFDFLGLKMTMKQHDSLVFLKFNMPGSRF